MSSHQDNVGSSANGAESHSYTHEARRWCKGDQEWTNWQPVPPNKLAERQADPTFEVRPLATESLAEAAEPFWHAVVSDEAPIINKAIRRADVAEEYAQNCRENGYRRVEVVALYRADAINAELLEALQWMRDTFGNRHNLPKVLEAAAALHKANAAIAKATGAQA